MKPTVKGVFFSLLFCNATLNYTKIRSLKIHMYFAMFEIIWDFCFLYNKWQISFMIESIWYSYGSMGYVWLNDKCVSGKCSGACL